MANPIAAGDVIQCKVVSEDPTSGEAFNILNFACISVGGTPATDQDVSDKVDSQIFSAYKALIPSSCQYRGIIARNLIHSPLYPDVESVTNAGAGTGSGGIANTQATGMISTQTVFAGKQYRGRIYIPWIPQSFIGTSGHPAAGYLTALTTLAGLIVGVLTVSVAGRTATLSLCVYHRKFKLFTYVLTAVIRASFATQKRRGNYGKNRTPPI